MVRTCKSTTSSTMEITGFNFIWYCYRKMAPRLNIYSGIYRQRHRQWLLESMECSSGGETNGRLLKRVLSVSLDPKKSWFALNSALCSGKPSRFCSLAYAQVFPDEYRQIDFDDLLGDNGVPASASWFSAGVLGRRSTNRKGVRCFSLWPSAWNPPPKVAGRTAVYPFRGLSNDRVMDQRV